MTRRAAAPLDQRQRYQIECALGARRSGRRRLQRARRQPLEACVACELVAEAGWVELSLEEGRKLAWRLPGSLMIGGLLGLRLLPGLFRIAAVVFGLLASAPLAVGLHARQSGLRGWLKEHGETIEMARAHCALGRTEPAAESPQNTAPEHSDDPWAEEPERRAARLEVESLERDAEIPIGRVGRRMPNLPSDTVPGA